MGIGLNKVIAEVLKGDITSADPQDWVDLYPTRYANTTKVPLHLYMCLRELLLGSGASAGEFQDRIVELSGEDLSMEDVGIGIASKTIESEDMMEDECDTVGAVAATVQISVRLRQPLPAGKENLCEYVQLRIAQLLDVLARQRMGFDGTIDEAIVALDPTIDSVYGEDNLGMYMRFRGAKGLNNALQQISVFTCHYNRVFLPGS